MKEIRRKYSPEEKLSSLGRCFFTDHYKYKHAYIDYSLNISEMILKPIYTIYYTKIKLHILKSWQGIFQVEGLKQSSRLKTTDRD